jgi:protein phosphatase
MTLHVSYRTDRGLVRRANEDSLFVDRSKGLFIVADGLGGHNAGDVASSMAVNTVSSSILDGLKSGGEADGLIRSSIMEAHILIQQTARLSPAWRDMGTTVVLALEMPGHFLIGHVGDSRAYAIDGSSITQLTEDHTFVAEWIREGIVTPEQARNHPIRHGLTMAVGIDSHIAPVVTCLPWTGADTLLLCSDGLTEALEDHEILDVVQASQDTAHVCAQLVQEANERGGIDNVTVIVIAPVEHECKPQNNVTTVS